MILIKQTTMKDDRLICYTPEASLLMNSMMKVLEEFDNDFADSDIELEWNAGAFEQLPVIVCTLMAGLTEIHFALAQADWPFLAKEYECMEFRWGKNFEDTSLSLSIPWNTPDFQHFLDSCFYAYAAKKFDGPHHNILKQIVQNFFPMKPGDDENDEEQFSLENGLMFSDKWVH